MRSENDETRVAVALAVALARGGGNLVGRVADGPDGASQSACCACMAFICSALRSAIPLCSAMR